MPAPQVNWRKQDNSGAVPSWNIGTIDAGTPSSDFGVLIWNNFAGTTDLSTMTNCTITTKDSAGGNTGELVTNKWVEVTVASAAETGRTPIGGNSTHPIQAGGNSTNTDGTFSPNANEILGVKNDGNKTNAKGNYAEVILRANVPGNATAGNVAFLTRVAYQYV
ncbi:hypothetical protein COM24_23370 [Bacillus toyonensis]|uniref:Uncharacterized protein n=3 Tax=Bacillus cereus group TaxID=86661 RepID=A0A9W4EVE0_BACTO|nr:MULTISPECIES: hypothetical protein [Bacillus]NIE89402.1 hypothetical protein [Bacillus sp. Ab-1751]OUB84182.1 hypothetical protein BK788_15050 [Bacillus thuringiensis serovar sinensis]AKE16159.1 hypothetical protein FORC5_1622 [Bacillus cereus]EJR34035.1 hypothetical protein IIE_03181 [Bacillus cereus VD045]KMQ30525.1 hypothetical protein TU58_05660 [Bacillus cereus]